MIRRITLLGSGHVAKSISAEFIEKGFCIDQVYSRNLSHALSLVEYLQGNFQTSAIQSISELDQINPDSDLYLLAVKDDAIMSLAMRLSSILSPDKFIAHCSGASPLNLIPEYFINRCCMWPMRSFRGQKLDWSEVPIFISGQAETLKQIQIFCEHFTKRVYPIEDHDKAMVHLAAVFANNFTNYNLRIAEEILNKSGLPLQVLQVMMHTMMQELFTKGPSQTQTGPAARGDLQTLENQIQLLKTHFPKYELLYKTYSDLILKGK